MSLKGRFVSISGSASNAADLAELARCHTFVEDLVEEILNQGGGVTETLTTDPLIDRDDLGTAQTFFWTTAQAVLNAGERGVVGPVFRVICNAEKLDEHVPAHRRDVWRKLLRLQLVELVPTPLGLHVGGEIRSLQVERSDALVLVGGGKGTHHIAELGLRASKPVVPLDTKIGSANNDGSGSVAHFRLAIRDPRKYLQTMTGAGVLPRLSLRESECDPKELARDVAELLSVAGFGAGRIDAVILTVVPVELAAALKLVGIDPATTKPVETPQRTGLYHAGRIAVACVGGAGNGVAGAVTNDLISSVRPRMIVLAGIAGGDPAGTALGDVVIAEQVIGYESGAVVGEAAQTIERRPIVKPLDHGARQFLARYLAADVSARVRSRFNLDRFSIKLDPVAAGDKLVRSAEFFAKLQADHHAKLRAVEMEALGFVEACLVARTPHFVVRGVSDHANAAKSDDPQPRAARNALGVAIDLCEAWLREYS